MSEVWARNGLLGQNGFVRGSIPDTDRRRLRIIFAWLAGLALYNASETLTGERER